MSITIVAALPSDVRCYLSINLIKTIQEVEESRMIILPDLVFVRTLLNRAYLPFRLGRQKDCPGIRIFHFLNKIHC